MTTTRRVVPILLLAAAVLAPGAFAQSPPVLSGPIWLPGDATVGAAAGQQDGPAIERGGNQFLAVWVDNRTTYSGEETGNDIYAVRLDAAGNAIDPTPIVIDQTYGYQRLPRVSWNGQNWLVVYESQDATGGYYETAIHAARVSPQGALLDAPSILVYGNGYGAGAMWSVASDGTNWCVVSNTGGANGVVGRRISPAGAILDATPVTLVPATYFFYAGINVVSARGEYLVTYQDNGSNLFARRFSGATLAPLAAQFSIPGNTLASNGDQYYVVFFGASGGMVGSRMSYTGTLLDPGGVPITDGTRSPFEMDVAWSGTTWWVSWVDGFTAVSAARITPANACLDFNGVPLDPALKDQIAAHGTAGRPDGGVQVVFYDHRLGALADHDAATAAYSPAAQPGAPHTISTGAPAQLSVDLVRGPGEFLAVYLSRAGNVSRVLAQRLDRDGNALGPGPVEVASGAEIGWPRAAWNGSRYLVVWADGLAVQGRRLDAGLSLQDAAPIPIMTGWSPDAAALGDTFLVAAINSPTYPQYRSAFGKRLDGNTGAVRDADPIPLAGTYASLPRVDVLGNRWIVVLQNNYSHDDPQGQVLGAFVAADGKTPGAFNVTYNGFQPSIAVAGSVALVVSRRNSSANANNDVQAVRMLSDGSIPAAPFTVSDAPGRQTYPSVAWDGSNFFVAWEDQRNQAIFFDPRTDIYAARIDTAGQVLDTGSFPIASAAAPEMLPAVVSGGGDTLIGIPSFRAEAPLAAYRIGVYHALGTFTDPPQAAFAGSPASGCIPLVTQFSDRTTGSVNGWDWSFGDGGSSISQNPAHTYSIAGIYSVAMTATGPSGFDTASRIDYVVAAVPARADFTASPTTVCAPLEEVVFTDVSDGFPTAWSWDFGDGTYSTEQHPRHAYQWPGTYTVTETVWGSCGSNTTTRVNLVQVTPPCGYKALALSDIGVNSSLAGDYTRTHVEDNLWEVMYEVGVGSGSGAHMELDHRWNFQVAAGVSVTFHIRTFRNSPWYTNDFRFQYSTDNITFQPLINSVPIGYKTFTVPMPANLSGPVWIRVVDTTHGPGGTAGDSVYVDTMDITSEIVLPPRPCGAVSGLAFANPTRIDWSAATSATNYDVMRGSLGALRQNGGVGDALCRKDDQPATNWSDLEKPAPGTGFYYVIRGEASGSASGTYDSAGAPPVGAEGRDPQVGTTGGSGCAARK